MNVMNASMQRRSPRAATKLGVNVLNAQYSADEWNTIGCCINGLKDEFKVGTKINMELLFCGITSETKITCEGEVIWQNNQKTGIKINALPNYEKDLISHQLRETLKLVGRRMDDFSKEKEPTELVELNHTKRLSSFQNFAITNMRLMQASCNYRVFGFLGIGAVVATASFFWVNREKISLQGMIVSEPEVVIATEDGTLEHLSIHVGKTIRKGDQLFMMRDDDNLKSQSSLISVLHKDLQEAKNKYLSTPHGINPGSVVLRALKAQREIHLSVFNAYKRLHQQGAISQELLLQKQALLVEIEGQINVANANSNLIKPYLDHYLQAKRQLNAPTVVDDVGTKHKQNINSGTIYKLYASPSTGKVINLPRLNGSSVTKGSALAVIQPIDSMLKFRAFVPLNMVDRITIGDQATIHIDGLNTTVNGKVISIDRRGGLSLGIANGQVNNLFPNASILDEMPAEVLLRIDKSTNLSRLADLIGSKASAVIYTPKSHEWASSRPSANNP